VDKIYALRIKQSNKYVMNMQGYIIWYPVRELIEQQKEVWDNSRFYSEDDAVEIVEITA
jgi:hypothetical protein